MTNRNRMKLSDEEFVWLINFIFEYRFGLNFMLNGIEHEILWYLMTCWLKSMLNNWNEQKSLG